MRKLSHIQLKYSVRALLEDPKLTLTSAYDENLEWCIRYVKKHSGTREDAADIFQESISAAWANLKAGKFQGDMEQFNAYLRQICKYKWINELKSSARRTVRLKDDLAAMESAADQKEFEEENNQFKLVQISFDSLGERCRELLAKFYYDRKSLSELACQMGLTEESVKTTKYRCMMRLRKAYLERSNTTNG